MKYSITTKIVIPCVLIAVTSGFLVVNITSGGFLKAMQWHREHGNSARMGVWQFELPRNWYVAEPKPEEVGLRRGQIFSGIATMLIAQQPAGTWAFIHQQEWQEGQKADLTRKGFTLTHSAFDLNGHPGNCVVGVRGSQYDGVCLFMEDKVFAEFNGRGNLKEIQGILGSGRMS